MVFDLVDGFAGNAAVEGDKVHPVLGVESYHVDEVLGGECGQIPLIVDDTVVYGDRADHGGALLGQLPAERLGVAVGGQVHDGLRPHIHCCHHLLHLHVIVFAVPGHPQIDVDFGAKHRTHAVGVQTGVEFIGTDGHLSFGYQLPNLLLRAVLFGGHRLHLRGDDALTGCVHLGCVCSHVDLFLSGCGLDER